MRVYQTVSVHLIHRLRRSPFPVQGKAFVMKKSLRLFNLFSSLFSFLSSLFTYFTATVSTSTSTFLGRVLTATQERAGLVVKYLP